MPFKGYCHYGWWTAIADQGAVFLTRPETNMRLDIVGERPITLAQGDDFTVLHDTEARFASKGASTLPMRLRRLVVQRTDGKTITLLTNDLERAAVDIAPLYKTRWQILRFTGLAARCLFERRHIGAIDKPPPVNPSRPQCQNSQNQLSLSYA